jgi:hypothetical protein
MFKSSRVFILLCAGFLLPLMVSLAFNAKIEAASGDTKVDYTSPVDGDDSISTGVVVKIYFTNYLRESSIEDSIRNNNTIIEDNRGNKVAMNWSYDGRYAITLTPRSSLDYDTRYYVYVGDDIRDTNNDRIARKNFYFRTRTSSGGSSSDYISDVIERENPKLDDTEVPIDTDVVFYFNREMDADTIDTSSVYLREYSGGRRVEAEVDYYPSRRKVVLTPVQDLSIYTRYEVVVTTRVRDADDNRLEESRWRFRTEREGTSSSTSTTNFFLISRSPAENGYLADPMGTISFRFSQDARASTVNSTTVTLTPSGSSGPINTYVSYNYLTREGQMTPLAPLMRAASYKITVTQGVKDTSGRDFKATSWLFTVGTPMYIPSFSSGITVRINGQLLNLEGATPYTKSGRVMVPFRPLLEATGAQVQYDAASGRIYALTSGRAVELTLNSRTAYVNGAATTLEAPPELRSGRTMIPLRFAAEAMGYAVSWDSYGQVASLTSGQ